MSNETTKVVGHTPGPIAWISGVAWDHFFESSEEQAVPLDHRKWGKGDQYAVHATDSMAWWFEREAAFWGGPEVDPDARYRVQACKRAAATIRAAIAARRADN